MRFVAVDWGTTRFRASLVDGDAVVARAETPDGISRLKAGHHAGVFEGACGAWLDAEPGLPVLLAGMVGSREGWVEAPDAACPAGAAEIAAATVPIDIGRGRTGSIVPGLTCTRGHAVDVMRGEETHLLGTGIRDGLVCLPGTHCKWARMAGGRIESFATFLTGELYGLVREHSMVGRPATEPADDTGFAEGLDAAWREDTSRDEGPLLAKLFGARAATVTRRLPAARLGPYLSGLLTGEEIAGAFAIFGQPDEVTIVADPPRSALYEEALRHRGVSRIRTMGQEETLLAGFAALARQRTT